MKKLNPIFNSIKKHTCVFSFISGILFAIPFIWGWLFPLTFFSVTLLFFTIKQRKNNGCFKPFFLFFLGVYAIVYTLFFKLYPFEGFGFSNTMGIIIVIFAWIAASLIHSVMGGAILGLTRFFRNNNFRLALSASALWVIYEWTLSLGELSFPWVNVSVGIIEFLPFLQTASLFGNGFITLITVFSCCLFGCYLHEKSKTVSPSEDVTDTEAVADTEVIANTEVVADTEVIANTEVETDAKTVTKSKKNNYGLLLKIPSFVLVLNLLIGTVLYLIPEDRDEKKEVCIIQGNVSTGDKWQSGNLEKIIKQHKELIISELEKHPCHVVLMAETVFPTVFREGKLLHKTLADIAQKYDTTIIFGALLPSDVPETRYNAMIAIYPDGTVSEPYYKQKLVPFGEMVPDIPIISDLEVLQNLNLSTAFIQGTECINISSADGTVYGPMVCYDSVFAEFARENVLNGAEIIAISTNDSWYKDGVAVIHHQSQSSIRAIETGRYVIRSANTGISCIINSKGKVLKECGIMTEETLQGQVYTSDRMTLYVILGNTSLYFSFGIVIILLSFKIIFYIKKQIK